MYGACHCSQYAFSSTPIQLFNHNVRSHYCPIVEQFAKPEAWGLWWNSGLGIVKTGADTPGIQTKDVSI